jgi:RHS repeat-associated protein
MVTDPVFASITRHDYLPFGDEIPGGVAGRNGQFGPYTNNVDEKFTGQVRDTETLNDFFNARYYTAPLMRFLSSDPGNASADPTDPQTWNGYAYVRNNPLNATDPSGMGSCTASNNYCGLVVFNTPSTLSLAGFGTWDPLAWLSASSASGASSASVSGSQQSATIDYSGGGSQTLNFPPILDVDFLSSSIFIDSFGGSAVGSPQKNVARPDWLNNITSIFGYDQRVKLPSCFGGFVNNTISNLFPFLPGLSNVSEGDLELRVA